MLPLIIKNYFDVLSRELTKLMAELHLLDNEFQQTLDLLVMDMQLFREGSTVDENFVV